MFDLKECSSSEADSAKGREDYNDLDEDLVFDDTSHRRYLFAVILLGLVVAYMFGAECGIVLEKLTHWW
jgi:hypothetical protein